MTEPAVSSSSSSAVAAVVMTVEEFRAKSEAYLIGVLEAGATILLTKGGRFCARVAPLNEPEATSEGLARLINEGVLDRSPATSSALFDPEHEMALRRFETDGGAAYTEAEMTAFLDRH